MKHTFIIYFTLAMIVPWASKAHETNDNTLKPIEPLEFYQDLATDTFYSFLEDNDQTALTKADDCVGIAADASNYGLEAIEACVLESLLWGRVELLEALLDNHDIVLPYLRKRFYRNHAMLTHLAASSPYASAQLMQALFSRGFCSKARIMGERMAWNIAQDVGNTQVAEFAKYRATHCKKTPPATPTLSVSNQPREEL